MSFNSNIRNQTPNPNIPDIKASFVNASSRNDTSQAPKQTISRSNFPVGVQDPYKTGSNVIIGAFKHVIGRVKEYFFPYGTFDNSIIQIRKDFENEMLSADPFIPLVNTDAVLKFAHVLNETRERINKNGKLSPAEKEELNMQIEQSKNLFNYQLLTSFKEFTNDRLRTQFLAFPQVDIEKLQEVCSTALDPFTKVFSYHSDLSNSLDLKQIANSLENLNGIVLKMANLNADKTTTESNVEKIRKMVEVQVHSKVNEIENTKFKINDEIQDIENLAEHANILVISDSTVETLKVKLDRFAETLKFLNDHDLSNELKRIEELKSKLNSKKNNQLKARIAFINTRVSLIEKALKDNSLETNAIAGLISELEKYTKEMEIVNKDNQSETLPNQIQTLLEKTINAKLKERKDTLKIIDGTINSLYDLLKKNDKPSSVLPKGVEQLMAHLEQHIKMLPGKEQAIFLPYLNDLKKRCEGYKESKLRAPATTSQISANTHTAPHETQQNVNALNPVVATSHVSPVINTNEGDRIRPIKMGTPPAPLPRDHNTGFVNPVSNVQISLNSSPIESDIKPNATVNVKPNNLLAGINKLRDGANDLSFDNSFPVASAHLPASALTIPSSMLPNMRPQTLLNVPAMLNAPPPLVVPPPLSTKKVSSFPKEPISTDSKKAATNEQTNSVNATSQSSPKAGVSDKARMVVKELHSTEKSFREQLKAFQKLISEAIKPESKSFKLLALNKHELEVLRKHSNAITDLEKSTTGLVEKLEQLIDLKTIEEIDLAIGNLEDLYKTYLPKLVTIAKASEFLIDSGIIDRIMPTNNFEKELLNLDPAALNSPAFQRLPRLKMLFEDLGKKFGQDLTDPKKCEAVPHLKKSYDFTVKILADYNDHIKSVKESIQRYLATKFSKEVLAKGLDVEKIRAEINTIFVNKGILDQNEQASLKMFALEKIALALETVLNQEDVSAKLSAKLSSLMKTDHIRPQIGSILEKFDFFDENLASINYGIYSKWNDSSKDAFRHLLRILAKQIDAKDSKTLNSEEAQKVISKLNVMLNFFPLAVLESTDKPKLFSHLIKYRKKLMDKKKANVSPENKLRNMFVAKDLVLGLEGLDNSEKDTLKNQMLGVFTEIGFFEGGESKNNNPFYGLYSMKLLKSGDSFSQYMISAAQKFYEETDKNLKKLKEMPAKEKAEEKAVILSKLRVFTNLYQRPIENDTKFQSVVNKDKNLFTCLKDLEAKVIKA